MSESITILPEKTFEDSIPLKETCPDLTILTLAQDIPNYPFEIRDEPINQDFSNIEISPLYSMDPPIFLSENLDQPSQDPILQVTNDLPNEDKLDISSDDESIEDLGTMDDKAD